MASERSRGRTRQHLVLSLSPLSPLAVRVPAGKGARPVGYGVGEMLCSLLLSDPSGSSDSLHSGSPSDTPRLLTLSLPR